MLKKATPILFIAAMTACSTPIERRQANGNDEFVKAETTALLTIPEGLSKPKYSQEYAIPPYGEKVNPKLIGKNLDIRAPLLILPMAEGTHVEEDSKNIKVIVESVDNSVDLKNEITGILKSYLADNNIGVLSENFESGVIETDWIESEEIIESNWWGADNVYLLRQRYRYDLDIKPHGRSGSLLITLVEHEEFYDSKDQGILLTGEDKRRYTVNMLNDTVSYLSVKREQALREARILQSLGINVELVAEKGEKPYWLANGNFKQVWDRLRIVIPELGLDIVDMDTSKGLYFVSLEESAGFWSSLWGSDEIPLDKGNYRLMIKQTDNANKTKILLHDVENKPLKDEIITEMYQAVSTLMEKDQKVR